MQVDLTLILAHLSIAQTPANNYSQYVIDLSEEVSELMDKVQGIGLKDDEYQKLWYPVIKDEVGAAAYSVSNVITIMDVEKFAKDYSWMETLIAYLNDISDGQLKNFKR